MVGGDVEPRPLDAEIRFDKSHLSEWKVEEGRHILVYDEQHYGFYEDYDDASREGLRRFGRVPFLIKRVLLDEKPRVMRNGVY